MRVKMRTLSANEERIVRVGEIVDFDEKTAMVLVKGGYADAVDPLPEKQTKKSTKKTKKEA